MIRVAANLMEVSPKDIELKEGKFQIKGVPGKSMTIREIAVPNIEYGHLESPCPISVGGIKGMGEGGAVAPPPALANAIRDALSLFGRQPITKLPMTPEVSRA